MSPIAAGLDGLLALLLVAALALGMRLNARLKALREGQAGFAGAVSALNEAAARAEAGLNALKTAQAEAHDDLLARIETARALVGQLERATLVAERAGGRDERRPAAPGHADDRLAEGPGGALAAIAALAGARTSSRPAPAAEPPAPQGPADLLAELQAARSPRRRGTRGVFDEELFEAEPPRAPPPPVQAAPAASFDLGSLAPARPDAPAKPKDRLGVGRMHR